MEMPTFSKIEFPFPKTRFRKKKTKDKILMTRGEFQTGTNGVSAVPVKKLLLKEVGKKAYNFINKYVNISENNTLFTSTSTRFNIEKYSPGIYSNIVNIELVNDIRWLNKFFESVNSRMPDSGLFIGRVEAKINRKRRILKTLPWPFNWMHYTFDFLHKRAAPKIKFTKRIYFYLTKGKGRVLTLAETLGRLVSCGFEIIEHKEINNKTWFVVKKECEPHFDPNPSYGPLFKMNRVGKNGKIIKVYKFRTMHPYAEYLQDYVLKINGYSDIGKPADDFRMTTWGAFMRRYWLDELPQLINVAKGEMRLVGIRPLSKRFLAEYPEDVKKMRLKYKPGCVPPYVALLKQDVEEYIESEKIYLLEKEKHPHTTDFKYFFKAVYNILTNKIRSA
jgi:lipopolysaccharide/colanic/teichoic acid biosynthesis glycosyltransferase